MNKPGKIKMKQKAAVADERILTELPPESLSKMTQAIDENMKALSSILEEELVYIGAQDIKGLSALREKKAKVLRDYQAHVMFFSQKPAFLKAAPEETRTRLKETGRQLADVAERNAKSLQAAVSATQSILDLVMSAAREGVKGVDSYEDPRNKGVKAHAYSPTCAPVAVDRTA